MGNWPENERPEAFSYIDIFWAKNPTPTMTEVAKHLQDLTMGYVAFQSLDETVLSAIERKNISTDRLMIFVEEIKKYAPFCFSCLGRSVGLVGFGIDNRERGLEILNLIELSSGLNVENEIMCESEDCKICDGLIGEIDNFIDLSCESVSDYTLETFKIGTIVDKEILEFETEFSNNFGLNLQESIKSQLNREIGIGVFTKLDLTARLDNPDSTIIIDTRYDTINLEIKSIFILDI